MGRRRIRTTIYPFLSSLRTIAHQKRNMVSIKREFISFLAFLGLANSNSNMDQPSDSGMHRNSLKRQEMKRKIISSVLILIALLIAFNIITGFIQITLTLGPALILLSGIIYLVYLIAKKLLDG